MSAKPKDEPTSMGADALIEKNDMLATMEEMREEAFQMWTKQKAGTPASYRWLSRSETLRELINLFS